MEKVTIVFDTNKKLEVEKGTSYLDISKYSIYKDSVLGVKKNNEIFSLNDKVFTNETIEFFDVNSLEGSKIYQAALKFIFEVALKEVYKEADIHYLHSVPGGMLGEIKYDKILTIEDISKIKREMARLIDEDEPFIKYNILKKELIEYYNSFNLNEKADNVKVHDNIVTIYKLKNYLNYFYVNMPSSTKYIKTFELKYLDIPKSPIFISIFSFINIFSGFISL